MLLNLQLTMESGQPPHFVWCREGNRYYRYLRGKRIEIWMEGEKLHCTEGFENYVREFLRLDDDLEAIYKKISTDEAMRRAIKKYRGLRLTRSDPWETLVCFLCSINNSIPRIRKNVQSLMKRGRIPGAEKISRCDLKRCRLGFREKFIKETARLAKSYDFKAIETLDYETAREKLMTLPGVGPKVADCVLLFGFGFLEAFPTDVWIERAMKHYYGVEKREVRQFAARRWSQYAGYAQQYLYCLAREELG